ncbi:MAG: dTDP-glucose 4,6-dehydratase [Actinomycetota bacterium]|nr:dTDP-glucose 4,6-dehydratase [Actinomycetota bacterium]
MKLLVTGAAGFIGSAFARLAVSKGGFQLIVVDSLSYAGDRQRLSPVEDAITFYNAGIEDKRQTEEIFRKEKPDAVVNFAAETHVDRSILDPASFIGPNVAGTLNLMELSMHHGVKKFVHISTDEVYGELPLGADGALDSNDGFTESDPLRPNSPYSASKASADMFVRAMERTYGFKVAMVRPSNNYGPWQYPEKLIPLTIAKALTDQKIPVYGQGLNVRTWLFVEDCAGAVMAVLEKGVPGEIYNAGGPELKQNIDVVRGILARMGKSESLIEFVKDRPGHDLKYALNDSKIRKDLGWKPATSFDQGLTRTVDWYLEHKDWLLKKKEETGDFLKSLRERFEKKA